MNNAEVHRRTLLSAAAAVSLSAVGLLVHRSGGESATIDTSAIAAQARAGDVLFRGTRSVEGNVVRWFDGVSDYTHAGVLVRHPAEPVWGVVHASSDTRRVTLDRLDTFTSVDGIAAAGLYRWRGASPAAQQTLQADAISTVGRPFDGAFDAAETTRLYCTELIWMLAQSGGWAGEPVLKPISTPLGGLRVITIESLLRDLPLQRVWHSGLSQPSNPLPV
ncbi:YiiX/YebB-like N1pC/P60 family cysteine hydrolase [Hydrogenophaga sp.]|uniref:YiiX/YebB-like N1pC/P60 family cysteine hydrolase n=1 Tax=Hydrogenophaga sp. TaxID=1904254 RepID=UPI0025B7BACD|nr:YiiX/YebB-like N1pC/P60 family cysteine hydrolase [Hydrogenophaga sp.]